MKSTATSFGSVAKSIHWISAILITVLVITGFRAGGTLDGEAKATVLMVHIPVAVLVLVLTLARLAWWAFFDTKPAPAGDVPGWQEAVSRWTHRLLYLLIVLMLGSGMALSVLSGAPDAVFGTAAMPDFQEFGPRVPHGIVARLLVAVVLLHAGAALYHHFWQKDDTLRRMLFGGAK